MTRRDDESRSGPFGADGRKAGFDLTWSTGLSRLVDNLKTVDLNGPERTGFVVWW